MKKVILTGATGFIGTHVLPLLKERGYEVHAFSSRNDFPKEPHVVWHRVDLLQGTELFPLLKEISAQRLLHLAWYAVPGKFWTSSENLRWVEATLRLARGFVEAGGQKIVAAGTCAEYDWRCPLLSEGSTPFCPATLYGVSKRATFQVLEKYCAQVQVPFVWGYIFYLFGPHEAKERFIPQVIRTLLEQRELPCSHGEQLRDFLHVEDVARAFVELLDTPCQGAFNIGSGRGTSLKIMAEKIAARIGGAHLLKFGALPASDPSELVADTRKLSSHVRWKPKDPLLALVETISWWQQRGDR